jgi:diguanylate cyclase (GGDEF)-like protein
VFLASIWMPSAGAGEIEVEQLPTTLTGTWSCAPRAPVDLGPRIAPESTWRPCRLPGRLAVTSSGDDLGQLWLRTRLHLSDQVTAGPLALRFSRLGDADEVFFNGVEIGSTGTFPPGFSAARPIDRVYPIPEPVLRKGAANELVIHLYQLAGDDTAAVAAPQLGLLVDLVRASGRAALLVVAFAVFFAMVAAHHLVLAIVLPEPTGRSSLLFAAFAATAALYLLLHEPRLLSSVVGEGILDRARLALLPCSVALLVGFAFVFFERAPGAGVRLGIAALVLLAAVPVVAPSSLSVVPAPAVVLVVTLALATAVGRLLVDCLRRRVPYTRAIGGVLLVYAGAGVFDILADLGVVEPPRFAIDGLIFPLAFLPLYAAMSMVLADRYRRHYRLATVDSLTGLLRRDHFLARLAEESERARRAGEWLVVAMLDLDGFKEVNDMYTHAAGDRVLQASARLIRTNLRPFDLSGRWGGDELCLAMVMPDNAEGLVVLERIRLGLADQRFDADGRSFGVGASIGVVQIQAPEPVAPDRMLLAADRALYRAKAAGGNRVEAERWRHPGASTVPAGERS